MSRIDDIIHYDNMKKLEAEEKLKREKLTKEYWLKRIRGLEDRIVEIVNVGKACQEHSIRLEHDSTSQSYSNGHFISNGWSHLVGFVDNFSLYEHRGMSNADLHSHSMDWKRTINGVGKIGGGACHYNLTILVEDNKIKDIVSTGRDELYALEAFVEGFEIFETSFYGYVDRITQSL